MIAHDWIINRHLLDDSFRPALQYLANKSVGDDFALRELRKNLRQQRNLVETLQIEFSIAEQRGREPVSRRWRTPIEKRIGRSREEKYRRLVLRRRRLLRRRRAGPGSCQGSRAGGQGRAPVRSREGREGGRRARQEVNTLHTLTERVQRDAARPPGQRDPVKRLLVHIRNNIFYYMQAIWSMEPPDQRFLRLHKVQVPQLELERSRPSNPGAMVPDRRYRVEVDASDDIFAQLPGAGHDEAPGVHDRHAKPDHGVRTKPLVEVADLDNLLGFKGNYMIFPLKEHNALTEFMAAPYVDTAFGAMDPDELSNVNLERLQQVRLLPAR